MENTPKARNPSTSADSNAVAFMADLTKKFGSAEEAMKAFALFTAMMEHAKPSAATTATPPLPTIPEDSTAQPAILHAEAEPTTSAPEKDAAVGEVQGAEADLAAELVQMAVDDRTTAKVAKVLEGETPVSEQVFVEKDTLVTEGVVTGGEIPGLFGDLEGETPEKFVGSKPLMLISWLLRRKPRFTLRVEPLVCLRGERPPFLMKFRCPRKVG